MALGDVLGSMTVELIDNGGRVPTPHVTFSPVGLITSGWHSQYSLYIEQEIERAQARVRLTANTDTTPTRRRRSA